MTDELKQSYSMDTLNKFRQWHFWWLVIFSFLLIVVFVYYLPTKFLEKTKFPHGSAPINESQPHGHDASGNSIPIEQKEGGHMTSAPMGQDLVSGGQEHHMNEHM